MTGAINNADNQAGEGKSPGQAAPPPIDTSRLDLDALIAQLIDSRGVTKQVCSI